MGFNYPYKNIYKQSASYIGVPKFFPNLLPACGVHFTRNWTVKGYFCKIL